MHVRQTLARLHDLAASFDNWARPTFDPPASPERLTAFRRVAGFPLPPDLDVLFAEHESIRAMDIHNGYWIGGLDALVASASDGSIPRLIREEPAVPIATDGGGNAFLVSASGRVWRWDHENGDLEQVAASVGEFLERVAADWAALAAGTPGWRFLV